MGKKKNKANNNDEQAVNNVQAQPSKEDVKTMLASKIEELEAQQRLENEICKDAGTKLGPCYHLICLTLFIIRLQARKAAQRSRITFPIAGHDK